MQNGVYRRATDGEPEFVEVPAPTDEALQAVLHKIITRRMKLLTRRALLVEEEGSTVRLPGHGTLQRQHLLAGARAEGDPIGTGRRL